MDKYKLNELWISNNGICSCRKHMGFYADQMLSENPHLVEFVTPLDHWQLFLVEKNAEIECETCRYNNDIKEHINA